MKIINVDNPETGEVVPVRFINLPDATLKEADNYVAFVQTRINATLKEITVKLCEDGKVDVTYNAQGESFERIRRITGYLVGTTKRWNDSKQAEERDRVKHTSPRFSFNHNF